MVCFSAGPLLLTENNPNYIYIYICIYFPNATHALRGFRGPPSWAWQECNRLLRLGRPWGAITLSRWYVSGDRGECSVRRGLKPKFYWSLQTMVTTGIFAFNENSDRRTGNRTRELMISSQRLWPLDHEVGQLHIQWCISQTQQKIIFMFITVIGQHVSVLIESSSGISKIKILN